MTTKRFTCREPTWAGIFHPCTGFHSWLFAGSLAYSERATTSGKPDTNRATTTTGQYWARSLFRYGVHTVEENSFFNGLRTTEGVKSVHLLEGVRRDDSRL